jgi:hypothetical protein
MYNMGVEDVKIHTMEIEKVGPVKPILKKY